MFIEQAITFTIVGLCFLILAVFMYSHGKRNPAEDKSGTYGLLLFISGAFFLFALLGYLVALVVWLT